MALVDGLLQALPQPPQAPPDPRLLARAAGPGRVRGIGLALHREALADPRQAGPITARGLRQARALHSRERRLVADAVWDLIRHQRALDALSGPSTDPALARWLAWLVVQGLAPAEAEAAWAEAVGGPAPPFARCVQSAAALQPHLQALDPVEAVALAGSLEMALAEALLHSLGGQAGAFLGASNQRAPVVLRANTARINRDDLALRLQEEGLPTTPTPLAPDGLVAERAADLRALRAFRDGLFEVQDEGSQLVGLLCAGDGPAVDLCAGAGGKALQLAAQGRQVLALDVRARALRELERRARRLGLQSCVRTAVLPEDGTPRAPAAACVLVDAPCSGTGTLRRHPELRLRLDAEALGEAAALQARLLRRGAALVAPGGRLVYATCSVLHLENEAVVEAFLAEGPGFELEQPALPGPAAAALDGPYLKVGPHSHGTDGFFGAVFRRPTLG